MKAIMISLLLLLAFTGSHLQAQDLVPATSEDIDEFDRQVAEQMRRNPEKKQNFGAEVSEEARKLKNSDSDQKNQFGKWVSSQRKKTDQGRPSAQGSPGNNRGNGNNNGKGPANGKGPKAK